MRIKNNSVTRDKFRDVYIIIVMEAAAPSWSAFRCTNRDVQDYIDISLNTAALASLYKTYKLVIYFYDSTNVNVGAIL